VTTNRRAVAISTSRLVKLLNMGTNGSETVAGAKRSSVAAAMWTMGWRHLVPELEGSFSRRETVCRARETRKSSGDWVVGMGRKLNVLSVWGTRVRRMDGKIR